MLLFEVLRSRWYSLPRFSPEYTQCVRAAEKDGFLFDAVAVVLSWPEIEGVLGDGSEERVWSVERVT